MDLIAEIYVHLLFRWPCLKEPSPLQYRSSDVTAIARYPLSKFIVHAVHFVQDISLVSLLNFECIVWHINCYANFIYFALGVAIDWNILYGNVKFLQNIISYLRRFFSNNDNKSVTLLKIFQSMKFILLIILKNIVNRESSMTTVAVNVLISPLLFRASIALEVFCVRNLIFIFVIMRPRIFSTIISTTREREK